MKRAARHGSAPIRGRGRRSQILIALAVAGMMLFNFPLLLVWDQAADLFGLPGLPVVLFLIWGGLIAALAWVNERDPDRQENPPLASKHDQEEGP